MSTDITPADVLEKAADILETDGWIKHREMDYLPNGTAVYCAIGAIKRASYCLFNGRFIFTHPTQQAIDLLTMKIYSDRFPNIPDWNDHPETTKDQVIDTFKQAAKEYRNVH